MTGRGTYTVPRSDVLLYNCHNVAGEHYLRNLPLKGTVHSLQ
jgi:hypothetical protein